MPRVVDFGSVPERTAPGGDVPSERSTEVAAVTSLPNWSCAASSTAGEIAWPATAFPGCTTKASDAGGPELMVKATLRADVNPGLVASSEYVPLRVVERS